MFLKIIYHQPIRQQSLNGASGYAIEIGDSSNTPLEKIYIANVVFENNALGGILINGPTNGSPLAYAVENNTFVNGISGITLDVPVSPATTSNIRNNIFAGQSLVPIQIVAVDDGGVEYSYNLFYDCVNGDCATGWHAGSLNATSSAHDNLFDLAPLFADPDDGNYHLLSDSPAIDAGDPAITYEAGAIDGDGDGIPQIDIGAFEFLPPRGDQRPRQHLPRPLPQR